MKWFPTHHVSTWSNREGGRSCTEWWSWLWFSWGDKAYPLPPEHINCRCQVDPMMDALKYQMVECSKPTYTIEYTVELGKHFAPLLQFLRDHPEAVVKYDTCVTKVDRDTGAVTFSMRGVHGECRRA